MLHSYIFHESFYWPLLMKSAVFLFASGVLLSVYSVESDTKDTPETVTISIQQLVSH